MVLHCEDVPRHFLDSTHQMPQRHFQPVTSKLVPSICIRPPGSRSIPFENCRGRLKGYQGMGRWPPLLTRARASQTGAHRASGGRGSGKPWGTLPFSSATTRLCPQGPESTPTQGCTLSCPWPPRMQSLWHWQGTATEPFAGLRHLRVSGVQSFCFLVKFPWSSCSPRGARHTLSPATPVSQPATPSVQEAATP